MWRTVSAGPRDGLGLHLLSWPLHCEFTWLPPGVSLGSWSTACSQAPQHCPRCGERRSLGLGTLVHWLSQRSLQSSRMHCPLSYLTITQSYTPTHHLPICPLLL